MRLEAGIYSGKPIQGSIQYGRAKSGNVQIAIDFMGPSMAALLATIRAGVQH